MRVVGPDGADIAKDDTAQGEIVLRAPWLTTGYLRDPGRGAQLWEGGYLHTGDVATIDPRNSIRIADRIKDVIKSGGEWISSIALESMIGQHPWVSEVAVIGIPDPKWGERPCAWVVATPGRTLTSEMLLEHLEQFVVTGELSKWAIPDTFLPVTTIPKTSVGKIDKKAMRKQ
jgi:fatty-acyl-CoA synthase